MIFEIKKIMRQFISLALLTFSSALFSQQQQMGNVYLANYMNTPIQSFQSQSVMNTSNVNFHNNVVSQQVQQNNLNNDFNDKHDNVVDVMKQTKSFGNSNGLMDSFSFKSSSRSTSTISSSASRSNKYTLTKKLKKFERLIYGKMGAHKKSKHLVDVCFNWR